MEAVPTFITNTKWSMSDDPYHFPPELMDLLIDTIPLLCRSKLDVLTFFRGCGVPEHMTADLRARVDTNRASINKYEITRTTLTRINEGGDRTLASRREAIKRVTEFEDFSTCWPEDRLKAQGLVASVRSVVNVKDSFTRLRQERENERRERQRQQEATAEAKRRHREERESLRRRLGNLGSMTVPRQRGLAFENLLNDIFKLDGLSVREAFTLGTDTGQVGEQIDGLIVTEGAPILVEAKWHATPLGVNEVSRHLVRVYGRPPGVHGLIVSASGFSTSAIEECTRALTERVLILAEVNELVMLLEDPGASVRSWLGAKLLAARVDRQVLFRPPVEAILASPAG
jgi:restriction system protein